MAKYTFACGVCGTHEVRTIPISEYDAQVKTQVCGCGAAEPMQRQFDAPGASYTKGAWVGGVKPFSVKEFIKRETDVMAGEKPGDIRS